jgi:hypothetical protein
LSLKRSGTRSSKVCLYRPQARTLSPVAEGFAEYLADWLRRWSEGSATARAAA